MRQVLSRCVTAAVGVEQTLQDGQPDLLRVVQVELGTNLVVERVPCKPSRRATPVTGFSRVVTSPGDVSSVQL